MRKNARVIVITISACFIITAIGASMYYRNVIEKRMKESQVESVKGNASLGAYPQVQNIPPSVAYVGVPYSFKPVVVVEGANNMLSYELVSAPDWLFLYDDRMFGLPAKKDIGEAKVALRIYNGDIYMDYVFYIQTYAKENMGNN